MLLEALCLLLDLRIACWCWYTACYDSINSYSRGIEGFEITRDAVTFVKWTALEDVWDGELALAFLPADWNICCGFLCGRKLRRIFFLLYLVL
ncbi:hypothetical protein B9Z19DRAFT_1090353 [Tuber borchii]|uniref:Secreted protein n=1 Tax=Tuber borchii TaxID=42251 RepID=A0A2T6ZJ05_TUBBO|nr:hypothetical protein B9Z19DRAFT_1090353 [Tuber borchii]